MICVLCERDVSETTEHHLIPKCRHKNKKNKKLFARKDVKEKVPTCVPCHNNVHAVLSEKELAREYNTLEKLKSHPDIIKFTKWVQRKPDGFRVAVTPKRRI
jgi:hypothetical protein